MKPIEPQVPEWIYKKVLKLPKGYSVCRVKDEFDILVNCDLYYKWTIQKMGKDIYGRDLDRVVWPKEKKAKD